MKLLSKFIIMIFCSCSAYMHSQTTMLDVSPIRSKSRTVIPPIEMVIDSVLKNNAQLSYREHSVNRLEENIKSKRIDLTRHFGLSAESRYGNLNSFSTNEDALSLAALSTTSKQFNYSVGFFLKIPLYDILNRKRLIKSAKIEMEEARSLAEAQKETMRQDVIRLYEDLLLKERLLEIKAKSFGNGKVNIQMVEKEFRNGVVPVAEYVRITSITSELEINYEQAKSDYMLAKRLLEDLAGFKFDIITD